MNDPISPETPPPAGSLRRKLVISLGALLVLLVLLYFVLSSAAFFKGFILPRIAQAMNAQITVADASIRPFSQVTLNKLNVRTTGAEPLLTAEQVRARYSLFSIVRGQYTVN